MRKHENEKPFFYDLMEKSAITKVRFEKKNMVHDLVLRRILQIHGGLKYEETVLFQRSCTLPQRLKSTFLGKILNGAVPKGPGPAE